MPRVALQATPGDLETLAGEWIGEYESAALGRHGVIEFKVAEGTGEAYGDVVMVRENRNEPDQSYAYSDTPRPYGMPAPEVLTIKFVRASNGSISGMLDRYWDPDRNCFAHAIFTGRIIRGVVKGGFTTRYECGTGEATGTWSAKKKAARPGAAGR